MGYYNDITLEEELNREHRIRMTGLNLKQRSSLRVRDERRKEILAEARDACGRLGGLANINERYSIVDVTKYTITEKKS